MGCILVSAPGSVSVPIWKSLVPPKAKLVAFPPASPQYESHLEAAGQKALKESFRSCDWNEKPFPG